MEYKIIMKIVRFLLLPILLLAIFIILNLLDLIPPLVFYLSSVTYKLIYPSNIITPFNWLGFGISYLALYFFLFSFLLYKIIKCKIGNKKEFKYSFYFCYFICLLFFIYGLFLQFS
jgi:hypothetical protein